MVPGGILPTGLVFSCFMVCITMGGMLFQPLLSMAPVEQCSALIFLVASLSLLVPVFIPEGKWAFMFVIASFMVFETCVGLFFPSAGVIRSKFLPGHLMSSIMNVFRLPL